MCVGAILIVAACLLQWWQTGGRPGELTARSDIGISDGRSLVMFLAALACLLVATLPVAYRKPVSIDRAATYLGLWGAAVAGYAVRAADLAGQGLVPVPPTRGPGFWLALAGLMVLAGGVAATSMWPGKGGAAGEVPAGEVPAGEVPAGESGSSQEDGGDSGLRSRYVPGWAIGVWLWLSRPPVAADRSASLNEEPRGRLDRMDIWVVAALLAVLLPMRIFSLGQPTQMYFDEVYHARTATEFLQDWRYAIPHDIYEWTHPMGAKYGIAAGIELFSDDSVTATGNLDLTEVKDIKVQQRTVSAPLSQGSVDQNADIDYGARYGDRIFVATGSEVRAYDLQTRVLVHAYPIPGAAALSDPTAAGLIYVGTSEGKVYRIDTNSLDDLRAGSVVTANPATEVAVATGISIAHIYVGTPPFILVSDAAGHIVSIDTTSGAGEVVGRGLVPGAADFAALFGSDPEVLVACEAGVVMLDARHLTINSTVATDAPSTSIALDPEMHTDSSNEKFYRFYVTAGNGLQLLRVPAGSQAPTIRLESDQPLRRMPGQVTRVVFDEGTRVAQVLGRTPDGSGWTVYAVETNGNAVFSDAQLPFEPVALGLDNAVQVRGFSDVTKMPDADREALLAIGPDGSMVSIDVGQFAFSWRVVGGVFGALLAVCLYLLARLLFRRRGVGLLVAFFSVVDGMLFVQSRIAMNDTYVGGLLLLAYLIFAVMWLGSRRNRVLFWLGMPLLGVVLGLALSCKWVALYAIASVGVLILVRSALGRLLTILGLAAGTGILGWMALAEMRYQPGTGDGAACLLLIAGAVATVVLGTIWTIRIALVPDKVLAGIATGVVAAFLLGGALLVSPGSLDNGAPNYTFFVIMLAITAVAAAANAYRPVAWTREELYFAIAAPPMLGLAGPFVVALAVVPFGYSLDAISLLRVAAETGTAGAGIGIVAATSFWACGRLGLGPLADPARPGSLADLAGPASPAPEGWLRLGSGYGIPAAWTMLCLVILPLFVYVAMYVPWSMPWQPQTATTGPLPAIACWHTDSYARICDDAWPAGHTGQTLWDLTNQMYTYHEDLRSPHPASSPWWAWPLDLKPVWFDSGSDVPGMFSWIHDGGNPALWWMAIFGIAFVSWQALKRQNLGLGLIAVAFFWQWLSWARVDRATFQYHFYTALPFFLLALAYFLAELWHGPSRRTWLYARVAAAAALLMPGMLWLLKPELCGLARVDPSEYWQNTACGSGTGDVLITTRVFLIGAVLAAALLAFALVLWRLEYSRAHGRDDRGGIALIVALFGITCGLVWWLEANGPDGVLIREALPADALTALPVTVGLFMSWVALTARSPRRFVLGVCVMAALVFAFLYPDLSALWMPNTIQGIYSVLSPTWLYGFWFSTNLQVSAPVKVIGVESLSMVVAASFVAIVVARVAMERRVVVAWGRARRHDKSEAEMDVESEATGRAPLGARPAEGPTADGPASTERR